MAARFANSSSFGSTKGKLQARLHQARKNRRARNDPTSELFRTNKFTSASNPIDTDALFANRVLPISFAVELVRTDVGSTGIIFEFGSATRGIVAALDGDDLIFIAGAGTGTPNEGVAGLAEDILPALNKKYRLAFTTIPGTGLILAWVNGKLVIKEQSGDSSFGTGGWGDDGDGAVGDKAGTVNNRIGVGLDVTLADASLIGSLNVFNKQIPKIAISG